MLAKLNEKASVKKVIAVDVGTDQFKLSDPRIELHEGTDIRNFDITEKIDKSNQYEFRNNIILLEDGLKSEVKRRK